MLSGRNCLRGSAACSRKGGPSVSGKKLLEKMPLLMPSLQDPKKTEYISEFYEKLIVRNSYYQVKMKCIGAGKASANEREKSLR